MNNKDKFPIIDVSNWEEVNISTSDVRNGKWLRNPDTNELAKFEYSGAPWIKKLAYELSKPLGMEITHTELAFCNEQSGSINYQNLSPYTCMDGVDKLLNILTTSRTLSTSHRELEFMYSIKLVEHVLHEEFMKFLPALLLDCLVGQSDKQNNCRILPTDTESKKAQVYTLYATGSSLCHLEAETRLARLLRDNVQLEDETCSKIPSRIGISRESLGNHYELFKYISLKYHDEVSSWMSKLEYNLSCEYIKTILNGFEFEIISDSLKILLYKFLTGRRDKMIDLYNTEVRKVGVF